MLLIQEQVKDIKSSNKNNKHDYLNTVKSVKISYPVLRFIIRLRGSQVWLPTLEPNSGRSIR